MISGGSFMGFERTFIANIGNRPEVPLGSPAFGPLTNREVTVLGISLPIKDATTASGACDSIGILVLFFWILWFKQVYTPKVVRRNNAANITPADFSVKVTRLPKQLNGSDHAQYETLLQKHFTGILGSIHGHCKSSIDHKSNDCFASGYEKDWADSSVVEISLARNYDGKLADYLQGGNIKFKQKVTEARVRLGKQVDSSRKLALEKQYDSITKRLKRQHQDEEDREVTMAFVTFNSSKDRDRILRSYSWSRHWLLRLFMRKELKFLKTHRITVDEANEPSNILWENLDFSASSRFFRILFIAGFSLFLLLVCSMAVAMAKKISSQNKLASPTKTASWRIVATPPSHLSEYASNDVAESLYFSSSLEQEYKWKVCGLEIYSDSSCSSLINTPETQHSHWAYEPLYIQSPGNDETQATMQPAVTPELDCADPHSEWEATGHGTVGLSVRWKTDNPQEALCIKFSQGSRSHAMTTVEVQACDPLNKADTPERQVCSRVRIAQIRDGSKNTIRLDDYHEDPPTDCEYSTALSMRQEDLQELNHSDLSEVNRSLYHLSCWCDNRFQEVLASWYDGNIDLRDLCRIPLARKYALYVITIIGAFLVVAVNFALKAFLRNLSRWEKPYSVSAQLGSALWKVFLAQFVNTGLIMLVINSNWLGTKLMIAGVNFSGEYSDISADWYMKVGAAIALTLLINVVSPHCLQLLILPFKWLIRRVKSRFVVVQADMDSLYTQPQFQFEVRYAQILNSLFVTTLYSSGMPLLNVLALLSFVLVYACDRILFLWGSARPPAYGPEMSQSTLRIVQGACLLHCGMGIAMFGQPVVFPSYRFSFASDMIFGQLQELPNMDLSLMNSGLQQTQLWQRVVVHIFNSATFPLFVIMALMLTLLIVLFAQRFLSGLGQKLKCPGPIVWFQHCLRSKRFSRMLSGSSSDEEYMFLEHQSEMRAAGILASYQVSENPKYKVAYEAVEQLGEKVSLGETAAGKAQATPSHNRGSTSSVQVEDVL
eukprot:GHVQ01026011.1.p1 GENE.GHVQ01026011.1~~GHVQ01026011.1.p1  ORF type:complete len:1071 (-),score=72.78 GHVQ01026011.1:3908-6910(-)